MGLAHRAGCRAYAGQPGVLPPRPVARLDAAHLGRPRLLRGEFTDVIGCIDIAELMVPCCAEGHDGQGEVEERQPRFLPPPGRIPGNNGNERCQATGKNSGELPAMYAKQH